MKRTRMAVTSGKRGELVPRKSNRGYACHHTLKGGHHIGGDTINVTRMEFVLIRGSGRDKITIPGGGPEGPATHRLSMCTIGVTKKRMKHECQENKKGRQKHARGGLVSRAEINSKVNGNYRVAERGKSKHAGYEYLWGHIPRWEGRSLPSPDVKSY